MSTGTSLDFMPRQPFSSFSRSNGYGYSLFMGGLAHQLPHPMRCYFRQDFVLAACSQSPYFLCCSPPSSMPLSSDWLPVYSRLPICPLLSLLLPSVQHAPELGLAAGQGTRGYCAPLASGNPSLPILTFVFFIHLAFDFSPFIS